MMLAALSVLSLGAASMPAPQDPPPTTPLPDVMVEQREPLAQVIRDFVNEVADPLPGYGPARWDGRVCVRVAYLRPELTRYMVDRIYTVARRMRLRTGGPDCRPNILIIAAANGEEMAQAMVDARPGLFLTHVTGANASRSDLERFQADEAPVRWWHITLPVDSDTGQPAVRLPGRGPSMAADVPSRVVTRIQSDIQRVFVVVDFNRASGTTIRQLSDYVAMVTLAQVNPDAETAPYDTILNLFADGTPPSEMTRWDRDYLRALYDARLDQRQPRSQLEAVSRGMLRSQNEPAEEDGEAAEAE